MPEIIRKPDPDDLEKEITETVIRPDEEDTLNKFLMMNIGIEREGTEL